MTESLQKVPYDSWLMRSQEGEDMCRVDAKKAKWYLSRNLALLEGDKTLRLNFKANGRGHANDPFYLQVMENQCVVCSSTTELTKHHIVPYCYRKFMPDHIKGHNAYDVLPVCVSCHEKYEAKAQKLKVALATEFKAPLNPLPHGDLPQYRKTRGQAHILLQHLQGKVTLPLDRVTALTQSLGFTKESLCVQDLEKILAIEPPAKSDEMAHGAIVVSLYGDLDVFAQMWRNHFVDETGAMFLPEHWVTERGVR